MDLITILNNERKDWMKKHHEIAEITNIQLVKIEITIL